MSIRKTNFLDPLLTGLRDWQGRETVAVRFRRTGKHCTKMHWFPFETKSARPFQETVDKISRLPILKNNNSVYIIFRPTEQVATGWPIFSTIRWLCIQVWQFPPFRFLYASVRTFLDFAT